MYPKLRAFLGVRLLTSAVKYLFQSFLYISCVLINPINKIYTLRRQTNQHSTVYFKIFFQFLLQNKKNKK